MEGIPTKRADHQSGELPELQIVPLTPEVKRRPSDMPADLVDQPIDGFIKEQEEKDRGRDKNKAPRLQ